MKLIKLLLLILLSIFIVGFFILLPISAMGCDGSWESMGLGKGDTIKHADGSISTVVTSADLTNHPIVDYGYMVNECGDTIDSIPIYDMLHQTKIDSGDVITQLTPIRTSYQKRGSRIILDVIEFQGLNTSNIDFDKNRAWNTWNKPVKDSFPSTLVADSVYIEQLSPSMKIDTIKTDTVGFESILDTVFDWSTGNTFMDLRSEEYKESVGVVKSWYSGDLLLELRVLPILEHTTDTTYILTPEQVKIQEILLTADKKKKLKLEWFNDSWYVSSFGGLGIYRNTIEPDSLTHLCQKKHCDCRGKK